MALKVLRLRAMPSRPLSADTSAVVKLRTRLDSEAIDLAKGRTRCRQSGAVSGRSRRVWRAG